jgi:transcriptional regulator with XRE-family HTH domain
MLRREARIGRRDRGLSLRAVGRPVGVSRTTISRFEHGLAPNASLLLIARILAVVGLDLSARAFPGPSVIRDEAHADLVGSFRSRVHGSLRWASEVPLPAQGDHRRWDGMVSGEGWRYGIEAETGPQDVQALAGRLQLKHRDGGVDGVLLVLPSTRRVRMFLAAANALLLPQFPLPGPVALTRLCQGLDPGGSSIIVLERSRTRHPACDNGQLKASTDAANSRVR